MGEILKKIEAAREKRKEYDANSAQQTINSGELTTGQKIKRARTYKEIRPTLSDDEWEKFQSGTLIDENYLNGFVDSYNNYQTTTAKEYETLKPSNYSTIAQKSAQERRSLKNKANVIRAAAQYTAGYNDDTRKYLLSIGNSAASELDNINTLYSSRGDLFRKYKTDEAYDRFLKASDAGWLSDEAVTDAETARKRRDIYEENKKRIAELKDVKDVTPLYAGASELDLKKRFLGDDLLLEKSTLETENRQYERTQKALDDAYYITDRDDFNELAQKRDYINPTEAEAEADWYNNRKNGGIAFWDATNTIPDTPGDIADESSYIEKHAAPDVNDRLGLFLDAQDRGRAVSEYWEKGENIYQKTVKEGLANDWGQLKDEEINIYYALYAAEGKEKADSFLDAMTTELNRRATNERSDTIKEKEGLEMHLLNLASIPANIVGGAVSFLDDAVRTIKGEGINPYNSAHSISNTASDIRGEIARRADEATNNKKILGIGLGDLYSYAMSAADSFLGSKLGSTAYGVLMGTNAATSTAREMYEAGASDGQIAALSILSGAAEMFFEKYSMDKLLEKYHNSGPLSVKNVLKNTLLQAIPEAEEEVATELANKFSDIIVRGNQSDVAKDYYAALDSGQDKRQASFTAFKNAALDVYKAGVGGFISGGLMGAGASVAGGINADSRLTEDGKAIRTQNGSDALYQLALERTEKSIKNAAAKMQEENTSTKGYQAALNEIEAEAEAIFDKGNSATPEDMKRLEFLVNEQEQLTKKLRSLDKATGRLSYEIERANVKVNKQDVKSQLSEKGGLSKGEINTYGGIISDLMEGNEVKESDVKKLESSETASAVYKDILENDKNPVARRNAKRTLATLGLVLTESGDVIKDNVNLSEASKKEAKSKGLPDSVDLSADESYVYSTDGEARTIKLDTETPVAEVRRGKVYLNTNDGVVPASSVTFGKNDADAAVMIQDFAVRYGAPMANRIIKARAGSNLDIATYMSAMSEGIEYYGANGITAFDRNSAFAKLTPDQREFAYNEGKKYAKTTFAILENAAKKSETAYNRKMGRVFFEAGVKARSELEKQSVNLARVVSVATGINIRFFDSTKDTRKSNFNGRYDGDTGTIWLDIKAGDAHNGLVAFAMAHELTHFIKQWSPSKYAVLSQLVISELEASGADINELVEKQMAKNKNLTPNEALEEVVCDALESMLLDSDKAALTLEKLCKKDKSLAQKIVSHLAEIIKRLRQLLIGIAPDSTEGKILRGMKDSYEKLETAFSKALEEAATNHKTAMRRNTAKAAGDTGANVKYSVRHTTDNRPVAVIEEDILSGVSENDWIKTVKDVIKNRFSGGIPVSGRLIKVNIKTRDEFTMSKNTRHYRNTDKTVYTDKFKSAGGLDDIILASTNYINEAINHTRNDNFKEFARGDVLLRIGKNDYSANVIIGFTSGNQMVLYDVIGFKPANFALKKTSASSPSNHNDVKNSSNTLVTGEVNETNSKDSISSSAENVNTEVQISQGNGEKFSRRNQGNIDDEAFSRQIDSWNSEGRPESDTFSLGSTGAVLQGLGAIESDIYMRADKVNRILKDHPEITLEQIKKIPELLENPILILGSKNDTARKGDNTRVVLFGDVKSENGAPMLSVLDLRPVENGFVIDGMQKVVSTYSQKPSANVTALQRTRNYIKASDVLYADAKRTASLLRTTGLQWRPVELLQGGYIGSISYRGQNVNIKGKPFSEIFTDTTEIEKNSRRSPYAKTDREALISALERSEKVSDSDKAKLKDYKDKLDMLDGFERYLDEIGEEMKALAATDGRDAARLKSLKAEQTKTLNRINIVDRQLLRLESTSALKTLADRERKLLKAEYDAALKENRNTISAAYKAEIKARIEKGRAENERKKAVHFAERTERIAEDIQKRLLHPTAKVVIPEPFAKSVSRFISQMDFLKYDSEGNIKATKSNVKKAEARAAITELAEQLKKSNIESTYGRLDISPDMLEWIKDISQYFDDALSRKDEMSVYRMTSGESENLYKFMRSLQTAINNASRDYVVKSANSVQPAKLTMSHLAPLAKEQRGRFSENMLSKVFRWDYATPATALARFGKGGEMIFDALVKGQDKMAFNSKAITDFTDKAYTEKEAREWQKHTEKVEIGGKEYEVTTSMLMAFHCLLQQEDSRRHMLEGGGIRFGDLNVKGKKLRYKNTFLTLEEAQKIDSLLTDRQKQVAEALQQEMETTGSEWGNEISLIRFGYKAFGIKKYFPIRTVAENSEYSAAQKRANIYALLNKSFTKERNLKANNAIIVDDIFSVFSDHMAEMALYNAWALPVIDTIRWLNYHEAQDIENQTPESSVKESLRLAYGKHAEEYIRRLLESINSQSAGGLSESLAFKNLRMFNRAAVAGNARVAVQQPISIVRAYELINPKYCMPLFGKAYTDAKNEMLENSGIALWKSMGYYDVDISRPLETKVKKNASLADKVTEKSMFMAEAGDNFTWTTLWNACKKEAMAKNPGINKEELISKTKDRFNEVIYRTQVVDSVLTKAQWMRSNGFWHRMTSSFMSENLTTYNMFLKHFDNFVRDNALYGTKKAIAKNFKGIALTTGLWLLSDFLNALATAPVDAERDEDDDKTYGEKFLESLKSNFIQNLIPLNMLPYFSDIVEYFAYGKSDRSDLQIATKTIDLATQIYKTYSEYTPAKLYKTIINALSLGSAVSGLPISNVFREFKSLWNTLMHACGYDNLLIQTSEHTDIPVDEYLKQIKKDDKMSAEKTYQKMIELKKEDIKKQRERDGKTALNEKKLKKKAESSIKSSVSSRFKKQYIEARNDKERMGEIRLQMRATGLFGSVSEILATCKGWLEDYED